MDALVNQLQAVTLASQATASEEQTFLNNLLLNNVIHEALFSYLTPMEFLRLAKTCCRANVVVQSYVKRAFNINRFLLRFFSDPLAFRSLQARTGTLVSGSSALQFFDRTFYPDSDLDLYLSMEAIERVAQWLIGPAGYTFTAHERQPASLDEALAAIRFPPTTDVVAMAAAEHPVYGSRGIRGVFTFTKPAEDATAPILKVQCIVAKLSPMRLILDFHSSTCFLDARLRSFSDLRFQLAS